MNPLLLRPLVAVIAVLAGGTIGAMVAGRWGHPVIGALCGAAMAVAAGALLDGLRGRRLLLWLRNTTSGPAPRDTGYWGELAYRTERHVRALEAANVQEKTRLAQFLSGIEASPNGVLLLDAGGHIEWCSRVAAEQFGLDPERDRHQRATNLIRSPAFVAYLQAGQFAEPLILNDPLTRQVLAITVRGYGEGQRLVLSQDITDRERNEAMRRDFVANVSHEIRSPLTVLAGFVETLATLPLSESERARVLVLMGQQTDRMQSLVADLLTLAQLEGGPRPPPDRWHRVADLFARAEADARALSAGRHQVEVADAADVEIAGDRDELLSAIGNLLTNAIRYTPTGGRVELTLGPRDGGGAVIEVADTGIGIAREHLPRLTERFYRVDSSRSRETGGTGLGLAIVKHVVQRHGGEVEIDSEPGRGSRFRLLLPPGRVRLPAPAPRDASVRADAG